MGRKNKYSEFLTGVNESDFDSSTFQLVDVPTFRNFKFGTLFWYCWTWVIVFLAIGLLGIDTYTCVNLLAYNRWSNEDAQPYRFDIAKWVFSGCILFQFCLVAYHWIIAYRVIKKKKIAQTYLNTYAKNLYVIRSYNYHCLFHALEPSTFFDWCTFLVYDELDVAVQILVIDLPRQVINVLTLFYYATDKDTSNDVIANIKKIATTNLKLAIILSLMVVSLAIFSLFFIRFLLGILLYLPIKIKTYRRNFGRIKKYCVFVINNNTRRMVKKYHKPRQELLDTGIMSLEEMKMNPLLNSSTTFFEDFEYVQDPDAFKMGHVGSRRGANDPFRDPERDPAGYDRLPPQMTPGEALADSKPLLSSSDSTLPTELPFKDSKASDFHSDTSYTGDSTVRSHGLDVSKLDVLKLGEMGTSRENLIADQTPPLNPFGNQSQSTIPSSFSTNWSRDGGDTEFQPHPQGDAETFGFYLSEGRDYNTSYDPPRNFEPPLRSTSGTGSLVYSVSISSPPPSYTRGLNRTNSSETYDNLSYTESLRFNALSSYNNQNEMYSNRNASQDSQLTVTLGQTGRQASQNLVPEQADERSSQNQSSRVPYPTRGPSMYDDRYH